MKKIFIYILFFLIGILLYLITNTIIEKFNIGFPAIIINKMNPPFNTQYIIDDQIKENIILLNIQYFHNALNTRNNSYPEVVDDNWLEYRKDILNDQGQFLAISITSLTCSLTLTLFHCLNNFPLLSIIKVDLSIPKYFLPYIDFSIQIPIFSHTSVKSELKRYFNLYFF